MTLGTHSDPTTTPYPPNIPLSDPMVAHSNPIFPKYPLCIPPFMPPQWPYGSPVLLTFHPHSDPICEPHLPPHPS